MKKSELTDLLRRCQDAEARQQELIEENEGLSAKFEQENEKLRDKINQLQFIVQCLKDDLNRLKPSAIDSASAVVRRASSDELIPTTELLRFLAS